MEGKITQEVGGWDISSTSDLQVSDMQSCDMHYMILIKFYVRNQLRGLNNYKRNHKKWADERFKINTHLNRFYAIIVSNKFHQKQVIGILGSESEVYMYNGLNIKLTQEIVMKFLNVQSLSYFRNFCTFKKYFENSHSKVVNN